YRRWSFFRTTLQNAEMALAKSALEVSRLYLDLCRHLPEGGELYGLVEDEYETARDALLDTVQSERLLDRHPAVQRSIELRNPYVDPMNAIQTELLRAWRDPSTAAAEREAIRRPLARSIAGIAAALRNTG